MYLAAACRLGTLAFMSPEVLRSLCKTVPDPFQHKDRDDLVYDMKADVW